MSSIVDKRTQEPEHGVDGANSKRPRFSSEEKEFKAGASEEKPELIEDVFSIVMSMLAPKEMLCLSCCSKSLMKMVTHQNVVRNAIMTGGHARRSLKCIIDLMKERKIYFPSALRLLRIACGQMCEMPGCYKVVHTVRSSFGIFCCSSCFQSEGITHFMGVTSELWTENEKLRQAINHARTARYDHQRKICLLNLPFQTPSGERAGPLITMTAIHEILAKNQTVEQFISALDCDYDTNLFDSVMSLDQQASLKAARNEEMEKKERDVRVKKFRQQKAGKLEETLEKIKALLDPRWKEFVLNKHYYSNDGWTRFRDFPENHDYNPKFESPLLKSLPVLRDMLQAPSRFSAQKKVTKIADTIDKVFEKIYGTGYHDFSFLSSDKVEEPFEAYLQEVLRQRYTTEEWVLTIDEQDLHRLESLDPLFVLGCKLSGADQSNLRAPPNCFSAAIVPFANPTDRRDTDEGFARTLWSLKICDVEWYCFPLRCKATFEATAEAFTALRPKILAYIHHPVTQSFLLNHNGRNDAWQRVKKEEVNKVWTDNDILLRFLQNNVDFESLRAEQARKAEGRWLGGHW